MDCRAFEQDADAFSRGDLSRERSRSVEEHRAQCERCRKLSAALAEIAQEAREIGSGQLSPRFWTRLERRLEETDAERNGWWPGWRAMTPSLKPVAVGACLLLGVWAGARLGDAYATAPSTGAHQEAEIESLPYLAALDGVPHGSFAELLIEDSCQGELQP